MIEVTNKTIDHHVKWIQKELFHDGGPHQVETSPLICSTNQWTGFYLIETSIMKKVYSTDMTKKSTEVSLIPLFPSDHVKHTDPVLLFSTLST